MSHETQPDKPHERFEGTAALVCLDEITRELIDVANTRENGRAQRTLYRHESVTIAMFAFRDRAALPAHAANAVVTIHCLQGRVEVTADDRNFDLVTGNLVRMEPKVVHTVRAASPAAIIVHIAG